MQPSKAAQKGAIRLFDLIDERTYFKGADGSKDLGYVADDIAEQTCGKYSGAPMRMRSVKSGSQGHGARHNSKEKHARELGYTNGLELIEDATNRHDIVIEQLKNGRLMFVASDDTHRYAVAEFHLALRRIKLLGNSDEYSVANGFMKTKETFVE